MDSPYSCEIFQKLVQASTSTVGIKNAKSKKTQRELTFFMLISTFHQTHIKFVFLKFILLRNLGSDLKTYNIKPHIFH